MKMLLKNKEKFIGYVGEKNKPSSILLKNNYLHVELQINSQHIIGKNDPFPADKVVTKRVRVEG